MFNRLKSFVLGGTAGSVAAPQTNMTANNTAAQGLQPEMPRMMRTKRKRDSSRTEEDGTDVQDSGRFDPLTRDNGNVELKVKKAKIDDPEAFILTPVSDTPAATEDISSSETPSRKRRRSYSSADDKTPLKRMRRDGEGLMAQPRLDGTQGLRHGELDDHPRELPTASSPFHLIDNDAGFLENDATSSQSTEGTESDEADVVAGNLTSGLANIVQQYRATTSSASHGLLNGASYKPSKRLRRQAKKYRKHVEADGDDYEAKGSDDDDEVESIYGIGLWPGSSAIPGSLSREPDDVADRIELPRRKPHLTDWGKFIGQDKPWTVKRRRAACEAQLPPSQTAE